MIARARCHRRTLPPGCESIRRLVIAFVREHEAGGEPVTNALLVERFPGEVLNTLVVYRSAARRVVGQGNGRPLPCVTDPQKRRIAGRIRAMRELKIRKGERPDPVEIPLVRLAFARPGTTHMIHFEN